MYIYVYMIYHIIHHVIYIYNLAQDKYSSVRVDVPL